MKGRKRLRRSAASTVKSYVVPDSDDEAIVDEKPDVYPWGEVKKAKQRKVESNLQRWIKHLTSLQKEEQKKVRAFLPSFPLVGSFGYRLVQGEEEANGKKCSSRN
jgi:hypothetical protein